MRVIAGSARGRSLLTPEDNHIRPTTDRVKESLFNMIQKHIYDSVVVDMFAGTGSLGIECISRGAEKVYFVDKNIDSLSIVRKNLEILDFANQSILIHKEYKKAIKQINEKVDIIFLDPPYMEGYMVHCIEEIDQAGILSKKGLIVVEHSETTEIPEHIGNLSRSKKKKYGKIIIELYENLEGGI